jgi:hypothetical protein
MKTIRLSLALGSLATAMFFAGVVVTPRSNASNQEQQTLTITASLSSSFDRELGDLITVIRAGEISSVSFKNPRRYRGFAIVDRTRVSQVQCSLAESEFGDVHTAGGSWIAVVTCPQISSTTGLDVPTLIQARAASTDPTDSMECWENTELRLGVCYNIGNEVVHRTKEHILLGRPIFP